jgi:hypothetical protein
MSDLVVCVEQRLGEQVPHVCAAEAADDSAAVSLAHDKTGEAEFR